jgi:hypothetical protein
MTDFLAIWLPLLALVAAFVTTGIIVSRGDTPLDRFKSFVGVFLAGPATMKTWALVGAAPVICLILSGVIAKVADNASWPRADAVAMARIGFFRDIGIGLEILVAIVLGALGAVTFKGQGPGGTSFQLSQDPTGITTASATAPAPPVKPVTGE